VHFYWGFRALALGTRDALLLDMKQTFHVYRNGRTYGVYAQPSTDGTGQELIEGGFFSKAVATEACARIRAERAPVETRARILSRQPIPGFLK
jgi:hypothetical protein